jgi:polyhydroxyalkanoate synthesis regulator phasin
LTGINVNEGMSRLKVCLFDSAGAACYNCIDDATRQNASERKERQMDQPESLRGSIASALRRMMSFGVGSALILQERTQEFIEQAIARGQEAQDEGTRLVQERRSLRKQKVKDTLDTRISDALEQLDVPSQKEIDALNQQIAALSGRIDELKSSRSA